MLLLLPLALIALLLLIDPPKQGRREHLTATSTIRLLERRDEVEFGKRGAMVPEPMKSQLASESSPDAPKDIVVGMKVGELVIDPAFRDWYAPATRPLTLADLDTYVASLRTKITSASPFPRYTDRMITWIDNGNVKALLKAYFLDQTAPSASPTPNSGAPRTVSELKAEYDTKSAQYAKLIETAVTSGNTGSMDQIRQLNVELSSLLEQMISTAEPGRQTIPALRTQLVERLRRIQLDYNGLLQNTDELETLRRIRAQEAGGFWSVFYWHLVFLGVIFVGVLVVMIYKRLQTTNASAESPTTRSDLE